MDAKPYKILDDLYKLFEKREGQLTEKEIGYFTGQMRALLDLYWEPDQDETRPSKGAFWDLKRKVVGE
jgi:hypothetical protein